LRNDGKRSVYFRAGTDCPPAVREAAAGLFDTERDGMLPEERLGDLEHFMTMVSNCGHELRAYDDALDFVAGRRDADRRASKLKQLFPRGAADPKLLALLKVPLYPYQAEGALFAVRAGRALIGDDMGLGKTIQAIAATEILARHFGVSKVLVICRPRSNTSGRARLRASRDERVKMRHGSSMGAGRSGKRTTPWTISARSQTTRSSSPIST